MGVCSIYREYRQENKETWGKGVRERKAHRQMAPGGPTLRAFQAVSLCIYFI